MKKKSVYKITNWKKYNQALIERGNLIIWFDENSLEKWYASKRRKAVQGRPQVYSDQCIQMALTLKTIFRLPLRATQGLVTSILSMMGLDLDTPNYSSFSRRASKLQIKLPTWAHRGKIDLVIDSTGLKIYGEGEWKVRTHGKQKRRTWRKLHVAVDPKSNLVISAELTTANITDGTAMPGLVAGLGNIGSVYADGAYTYQNCFDAIAAIGAKPVISIRTGTSLAKNPTPGLVERNRIVKEMWAANGRAGWKKSSDYHRRSLAETHMFRNKQILGEKLSSRKFENQRSEAQIRVGILNKMTKLGMPVSVAVK